MVKMSTRVWSFILTAVMLVSMFSCIASAQYDFSAVEAVKPKFSIAYNYLVGPNYQGATGVYVIDEDWAYDEENFPETVKFTFRDVEVEETYNPNRHFSSLGDAFKYNEKNAIANPIYILTEGIYTTGMAARKSATILGPKAGMDPNVRDADPTKEWQLSAKRYLPGATETDTQGEAVIRPNSPLKVFFIENDGNVDVDFVLDGLVFQGSGAGVGDETYRNGGSMHRVFVQNCILDDAHATEGRGSHVAFGFDMRNSQEHEKHLYVSNTYVTNMKNAPLYGGHATVVSLDGVSYQRCYQNPTATIDAIQWQGQRTSVTNCHFWNPTGFTTIAGTYSGYVFYRPTLAWCSNPKQGNDEVEFAFKFQNNTLYNMGCNDKAVIYLAMGGNDSFRFENNILIDANGQTPHAPVQIDYVYKNGKITRVGIGGTSELGEGEAVTEGYYQLDKGNVNIHNNTFVGAKFQKPMDIGINTHPDTNVQMTGNLYLDSLDSTEGKIINEGSQIYNQWVWLDAAMTQKSSQIYEPEVSIKSNGVELDRAGNLLTLNAGPKEYSRVITVDTHQDNGARVYAADANWNKLSVVGENQASYELNTSASKNYYVVSITSVDGRTEYDFHLKIDRAPNPDAQVLDVIPKAGTLVTSDTQDGINFNVKLAYRQQDLSFALQLSPDATTVVRAGLKLYMPVDGYYTVSDLKVGEPVTLTAIVTGKDGLRETFYITVEREPNNETEILGINCGDTANVEDQGNNTFFFEVENEIVDTTIDLVLSPEATATMREPIYNSAVPGANASFNVTDIPVGQSTYTVDVLAQNGVDNETWYVVINRKARTGCELVDILDTEKIENVYFAFTANKNYMVNAVVSPGATFTVYKDADCTEAFDSTYIALTQVTTTVWIRVVAEDGIHQSAPIKLVVSSYADFGQVEEGAVKLDPVIDPFNGAIVIDGATFIGDSAVVIPLAAETESFEFQARPRNGYDIRVMSDATAKPMRPDETKGDNVVQITLKPDSGYTVLYATASKDGQVLEYMILILSPKRYTYTDKQTPWAQEYVEDIANNGFGLMKGDQNGAFNGEKLFTRYEMAALMVRMAGANAPLYASAKNPFSDVADSHWATNYVKAAYRMELINGYETTNDAGKVTDRTYQGDKNATRSEFFRVYSNVYLGMDVDDLYEENKKEIDAFVKALELKDLDKVADWAKPAVYFVIYMEWVIGDHNKNVNPENNITRNEVATVLSRNWNELYK